MPYKFVKISKSGMPYFYEFDRDILVKLRTQYLLHSHGIKSSGLLGLFVVWMKASERHVIGKNFHFGYQFGQKFLYAFSWFINNWHSQKSLPNGQKRVVNTWCWHWPQLFTLPSLAVTQIKLILQQSCFKKSKKMKRKKCWKRVK